MIIKRILDELTDLAAGIIMFIPVVLAKVIFGLNGRPK